jgi:glycerol-3-phosphate dehydrogenase
VAEGVHTAVLVLELAERFGLQMPVCAMIDRVVRGEIAPADAYFGLTPAGHERDPG